MKKLDKIKRLLNIHYSHLKKKYKVKKIGIFGSYIKGKQNKLSDIDILVDFIETPTLFEFIELQQYLTKLLRCKVDLVTRKALKPHIGKIILREVIYV